MLGFCDEFNARTLSSFLPSLAGMLCSPFESATFIAVDREQEPVFDQKL